MKMEYLPESLCNSIEEIEHDKDEKELELSMATIRTEYSAVLASDERMLTGNVVFVPKTTLLNTPLEVEIRGFSGVKKVEVVQEKSPSQLLEMTEECINQAEPPKEDFTIGGTWASSNLIDPNRPSVHPQKQSEQVWSESQGQYFLEGCQVLYQVDPQCSARLEYLQAGTSYSYPLEFMLPPSMPVSVNGKILPGLRMTVRYTLQVKVTMISQENNSMEHKWILPVTVKQPLKNYPYQVLACTQTHRCYHSLGKRKDQLFSSMCARFLQCACPSPIYDSYLRRNKLFRTRFSHFDLFHLQLLAVVTLDHTIFLTARSYQEPESDELTSTRPKQHKDKPSTLPSNKISTSGIQEMSHEASIASIRASESKKDEHYLDRVDVELIGQLVGFGEWPVCQKSIELTPANYDMMQGQTVMKLDESMNKMVVLGSQQNQLYTMRYFFRTSVKFSGSSQRQQFDHFLLTSQSQDLPI